MRQSHCSRHEQLVRQSLLLVLATYATLMLPAAAQTQTYVSPFISTDSTDYNAGDEVLIVGDQWIPGEFVTLRISEDGNPGHVDTLYATADVNGLVTAEYVVPGHGTAQNFTLTATGASSGAPVSTVFSNAASPASFAWDTSSWTTAAPAAAPWVRTDLSDYSPGEVALVAGGGWNPGDLVTLAFTEAGDETFHPTVYLHAVADETGSIYGGFVLQPHDFGASYELAAVSSGDPTARALTAFTDGSMNFHTCALTTGGAAKCWGANGNGQVGDSSVTTQKTVPTAVSGLSTGAVLISAGGDHTCVLTLGGGVKCWGRNSSGELGDGSTTQRTTPVDVSGLTSNASQVSAGANHSCVMTTGGGVKCWGSNINGRLGDGTTINRTTPVDVVSLTSGVVQVQAGGFHTCALTTGGGVKCWGWNFAGQLGDGTTVEKPVAVDVIGLSSGVAQISAGGNHTCALTTLGGVKCWGSNGNGQLGDGTTTTSTTPVDVSGLTSGVVHIATGTFHTCAVTNTGAAKCWGLNDSGRLGDGTTTQKLIPTAVFGPLTGVAQMYAGGDHSCALMASGGVKCWGSNGNGQLGTGGNVPSLKPVDVSGLSSGVIAIPEVKALTYTLSYSAGAHGTISGAAAQIVYAGQSGTAVTAVPDAGYHFVAWSDGLLSATRTDSNVAASLTFTANFAPDSHTLTYTADAHGAISGTSPQTVNDGADGTLVTAVADTGYHFITWSDGVPTATRTDTHVTADLAVSASFAINTYALTYTAGAHGTISGTTTQTVDHGADGAAVTAVADTGYHFAEWSDGSAANPRTDTNVTGPIAVTASFAINQYALTYTAGAHGTVSGATTQTVDHGTNGTAVTAVADTGYHFVQWSDDSTANPRTDASVTGPIAVTASFAINQYALSYTAGAHGTVSGATTQTVDHGTNGTAVTAVAQTGYHFAQWSDGSTANPRTDTNVTGPIVVTASFAINQYALAYTAEAHGTVSGATSQTVNHGANGTAVTAAADTGYHFAQWSDGSAANPRTDTNVTGPIAVIASFAINQYTLSYTAGAHGTLSGTSPQTVNDGASGSAVTAVPDAGYLFDKWSDGSTANPRTDANVGANVTVTATFSEVPYVVAGFFAPVDMPQANVDVWNSAQAGQTVPVKWRLTKNGEPVSDPSSFLSDPGGLFSYPINCSSGESSVDLAIEEYAPGNSALAYKGNGYWQFNWQTLTAYKGSCRVMFVRFRDGTVSATANFKFK